MMVCFLLFFSSLHLIDWNRELIGRRGGEFVKLESSFK